eukprot:TRINITY_DN1121_c0_g1_i3.p3 TRINITY_DN1121_c0_g1~~TRINITY_DN1121_c0_g1_i3.p3  ORF type:complete len:111 (+),score=16.29 TRINITY_DN1121_c0_g1_i3:835-1167(+)
MATTMLTCVWLLLVLSALCGAQDSQGNVTEGNATAQGNETTPEPTKEDEGMPFLLQYVIFMASYIGTMVAAIYGIKAYRRMTGADETPSTMNRVKGWFSLSQESDGGADS